MTTAARLFISGIEYTDVRDISVNKTISENTSVSSFIARLDSPYGRHKNDFKINNEVKVYAGENIYGLNAYYTFNSSGILANDFFNRYNGSFISGGIGGGNWALGITGSAIQFGSPAFFVVSGLNPLNLDKFTVSFWANPSNWAIGNRLIDLRDAGPTNGFSFIQGNSANSLEFSFDTSTLISDLPINTWSHIVGQVDRIGSYSKLYRNGLLVEEDTPSSLTNVASTNFLTIGKRSTANSNYFSGIIDEVRFYDRVLTTQEISSIYNSGVPIEEKNIFTGTNEVINFQGAELDERVTLQGNDYSSRLLDNTIPPTVYTNTEIGSIVRDIIKNNTTEIGSEFINSTPTTLKRISFNEVSIYDSIQKLSNLSGYNFYVDNNKQLHFEIAGGSSTGITLGSANIINTTFDKTKEGMANIVKVYGDRYLITSPRESYVIAGQGSVFTLGYKPHSTKVSTSLTAGSLLKGGIFEISSTVYSGTDYLVNFDDKNIILISGNNAIIGYNNIPPNGGSIVIDYDRSLPIIKAARNENSFRLFGAKTKVINDKSIKDPRTAIAIRNAEIQKSEPLNNIQLDLKGWFNFEPGQTVNVSIPNFGLNESGIPIIQINYKFDDITVLNNQIISTILDKRPIDITDKIRDINNRIEALESQDRIETDILTRLQYSIGSASFVGSRWYVSTRKINDSFLGGHPHNGRIGNINNNLFFWNFDTSGTYVYDQINNGSALLTNDATITSGLNFGSAIKVTGSNAFAVFNPGSYNHPDAGWLNGSTLLAPSGAGTWSWSINAWINVAGSSNGPSGNRQAIFGTRIGATSNLFVSGTNENPNYYTAIYQTDDSRLGGEPHGSFFALGSWNNVGVSWRLNSRVGDTGSPWYPYIEIYINGSLINAGSYRFETGNPTTMGASNGSYYIGWDNRQAAGFNGKIDNLQIFTRFLSGPEQLNIFNGSALQPFLGDRRGLGSIVVSGGYYA